MKKYKYYKTVKAKDENGFVLLDKQNQPIIELEEAYGYKETIFGRVNGHFVEADIYYEKTSDIGIKWTATEGSTGFLCGSGKTLTDCKDEVIKYTGSLLTAITTRTDKIITKAKEMISLAYARIQ